MARKVKVPEPFRLGPFRYADAIRAGLTHGFLNGPTFRAPYPGIRVPCTVPDTLLVRCQAASLLVPADAAFSHHTAATLCSLPVPESDEVHVIVAPGAVVPQIGGIFGHTGLHLDDAVEADGLRVVTPERTFFHLATTLTVEQLVLLGDAIVRQWCSVGQLIGRAAGLARHRGIARAREALQLIKPGVDSAMESRVRLMIIRAGLPCPVVNIDVFDTAGRWIARPDLSYPHLKIAIEYDGDHHRTEKHQWRRDRQRDESLRHAGWVVITLTADDVFRRPEATVARIAHYYRLRSASDGPTRQ